MNKKVLVFVIATTFIVLGTLAGISYLRGFKLDTQNKGLARTGLLVIDSTPDGAQVFLDGRLTSATDTTITFLTPKKYNLRLTKEGYNPWEKEVEVRADLTTEIESVLFPKTPDLRPLTYTGAVNPQISPDGSRLVYGVSIGEKSGLWVIDMTDRPLGIGGSSRQIVKNTAQLDFTKAILLWSPESSQILAQLQLTGSKTESSKRNFLLAVDKLNENLSDVTATLPATMTTWQQEINLKENPRILRLRKDLPDIASASGALLSKVLIEATQSANFVPKLTPDNLNWSPNETKFFTLKSTDSKSPYSAGVTVWRVRDPNPLKTTPAKFEIPGAAHILWYPSSGHLILVEKDTISIIEYEGTNRVSIFTGPFENNFVFPWPNGTKLVILTNFNQSAETLPNLYTINLR